MILVTSYFRGWIRHWYCSLWTICKLWSLFEICIPLRQGINGAMYVCDTENNVLRLNFRNSVHMSFWLSLCLTIKYSNSPSAFSKITHSLFIAHTKIGNTFHGSCPHGLSLMLTANPLNSINYLTWWSDSKIIIDYNINILIFHSMMIYGHPYMISD